MKNFRYIQRPDDYVLPDPTVALNSEEKHKKQAFELLNMAQVFSEKDIHVFFNSKIF